jgi:hypothetical protein
MGKSLLSFALILGVFFSAKAQWVSVPDSNFGKWLNTNGYISCLQGNSVSGWQMDTTCNSVVNATAINCSYAGISSLEGIQYFDSLNILDANNNSISELAKLPQNLLRLNVVINQLTYFPSLPENLTELYCHSNQLDSIPLLPQNLLYLAAGTNQVKNLPSLPSNLIGLYCDNNLLTSLPNLPSTLTWLSCEYNEIGYLPALPNSLTELWCYHNQITTLPDLPDSMNRCLISNNPITCLPLLKKINFLKFDSTGVTCIPNYGSLESSIPDLYVFPLCDFLSNNSCPTFSNFQGKVYSDVNLNCVIDSVEAVLSNLRITLSKLGVPTSQTFTRMNGAYFFENNDLGFFEISIDTIKLPFTFFCPDSGYYTSAITTLDSSNTDMNFGLRCKPGFDLEARSIATPTAFRPANFTQVNISAGDASNFYNAHCAAGISGAVTITISGSAHYTATANGSLAPTVNGNTLTYTIADFGTVDFFHAFNFLVQTDTTAVLGSQICITVSVTPTTGDNNPANNTLTMCFPVVNSFDPNDKTAYPAGDIDTAQKEITYTVRFQNTGTAAAQHIYITYTLDTDIDEGSFQVLAYSHQPMVQIEKNHVRFNFPNINLPDSNTNEPLSHGYVQYKVKLKDNLPIGTTINNTAYIYFDFNAPVVTNTTGNTIITNTSVTEIRRVEPDFKLNPNPARDAFTVSVSESFIGETLTITDITGKQMAAVQLQAVNSKLETSNWASGVYLVRVGNAVKKLAIQK